MLALAELAIWQGRYEDARALLDTALSLFDDLTAKRGDDDDLPGWEGVVCYVLGLRLEANSAELARARRTAAGLAEARRRAEPLIAAVRQMTNQRGRQAYAQEALVPLYATVGEAEFARLEGRSDPQLWHKAATLWDDLSFAYPAPTARFREAEALLAHGRVPNRPCGPPTGPLYGWGWHRCGARSCCSPNAAASILENRSTRRRRPRRCHPPRRRLA